MSLETFSLSLPRNAFSVRDAARAGDVWRAFQDAAVLGSSRRGWPPARYQDEECAFVVRSMTVVHHRETRFGEAVEGSTWVERFRRGMFSTRQIRLGVAGEPLADAIQEWVHVVTDGGQMRAARASDSLLDAFVENPTDEQVVLPGFQAIDGAPPHTFRFTAWFTWMDPLNHANHPAYVDFCDEAISRVLHRAGLDPIELVPVAEQVRFKNGVLAMEEVTVTTTLVGRTDAGDAVIEARVARPDGACAEATLVRRMVGGADALVLAMSGRG
ncbi:MAG: thioesterase [Myxococcota bacterium]